MFWDQLDKLPKVVPTKEDLPKVISTRDDLPKVVPTKEDLPKVVPTKEDLPKVVPTKEDLPNNYFLKNLEGKHYKLVFNLLRDHSQDLITGLLQKEYHEDYVYWFLKTSKPEYCIGLIHNDVLIGVLLVMLIKYHKGEEIRWIANGWQFCLQRPYRNSKLSVIMLNEMKQRLNIRGIECVIFEDVKHRINNCYDLNVINIPINYDKLIELELITDYDDDHLNIIEMNTMKIEDIAIVTQKMNEFNKCYQMAPHMDEKQVHDFLLPRKYVTYTFVKRTDGQITDLLSFYQYQINLLETGDSIIVAHLGLYFFATSSLEILICSVKDKLKYYGFDQISYYAFGQTEELNLTSYETEIKSYYSLYGCDTMQNFNSFTFIPI